MPLISITDSETSLTSKILLGLLPLLIAFILSLIFDLKPKAKAYFRIRSLKKQGATPLFSFFSMGEPHMKKMVRLHKDALYSSKSHNGKRNLRLRAMNFGSKVALMIHDPALIKDFHMKPENYIKDPYWMQIYNPLFGKGLLSADGPEQTHSRKIISKAFHFENIKSIVNMAQKLSQQVLRDIQTSPSSMKNLDVTDTFQKITGGVIGKMFFDDDLLKYNIDGMPFTDVLSRLESDLGRLAFARKKSRVEEIMMKRVAPFREACLKILQEKILAHTKGNTESTQILDLLLNSVNEEGQKFTDQQILDHFVTLFGIGMNNPGHLTTMAIYCLTQNPEYIPRLREEIRAHYKSGNNVDFESLDKMELMTVFLKECIRMYSPVPSLLPRYVIADHKLGDFVIKKGEIVLVDYLYGQFHPKFFPEPMKFNPERWLDDFKPSDPSAFIPFSLGKRGCLGQVLSMQEAKVILSEFLRMYDFKLTDGYELEMDLTFLYEPTDRIMVSLTPRAN